MPRHHPKQKRKCDLQMVSQSRKGKIRRELEEKCAELKKQKLAEMQDYWEPIDEPYFHVVAVAPAG